MTHYIGGIDAGGTTFKCGIQNADGNWVARERIETTSPQDTVTECARFFSSALMDVGALPSDLIALGLASFGPLNLDSASNSYGSLLGTPKPGWSGFPIRQAFADALGTRVAIDTDVNAALLAEMAEGAAQGVGNAAYITVGTGIGAGIASAGKIVGRPSHPEFGHIPFARAEGDDFEGACSYHATCLEGMASVTALKARFGDPVAWNADHKGWDLAADYLAQACRVMFLTTCAEKIVLGGGLMTSPHILPRIRHEFEKQMARYLDVDTRTAKNLIVTPHLGDDAGILGAIQLVNLDQR